MIEERTSVARLPFDLSSCYPHVAEELTLLGTQLGAAIAQENTELAAFGPSIGRQSDLAELSDALLVGEASSIALTASGQSALMAALFICGKSLVAVEKWTFPLAIAAVQRLQMEVTTVEVDEHGLRPEAFEQAATSGARLLYTMPSVHNPLGMTTGLERRYEIVDIARRFDMTIIEDAAYAFLESESIPSLLVLAPERTWQVLSLSKMVSLAARAGAVVFPLRHLGDVAQYLRVSGTTVNPIMASAFARLARSGGIRRLVELKQREGAARQQLASSILGRRLRSHPNGWFFLLDLATAQRATDFASDLRSRGVHVLDGRQFTFDPSEGSFVRVSLGGEQRRERLSQGLALLKERLDKSGL